MRRCELPEHVRMALAELKEVLSRLYGERLRGIYLYGSYARGDYCPESDVDVLVVLGGPVRPGLEITRMNSVVAVICLKYDLLISLLPVAVEAFESERQVFYEQVRREAVPV
ncbi:MAG: nucleotidyltransferase domain-containing protein [Chloroflexi bacterium]|nr:nucleotidyltransferase domain-containing protein [Chloroflexota bacterium]